MKTCGTLADGLTQHLADVGFDVDILEVLKGVSVEESESGVQSDGHPDAITMPGQLTDLAVLTRVGIKRLLQFKSHKNPWPSMNDRRCLKMLWQMQARGEAEACLHKVPMTKRILKTLNFRIFPHRIYRV